MPAMYAAIGILLLLVAIPLGLMLAPLVIGAILLWVGIRRGHRAVQPQLHGAPACRRSWLPSSAWQSCRC